MATITGLTAARMLAIEAASVVDGDVVGDDLILRKFDNSTINAGNVRGSRANRNRIINGDFAVNQRAFTSSAVSAFGHDRWQAFFTGGTCAYSTQTAAFGTLPESAGVSARLVTSGQSAAADLGFLTQKIESVRSLSGKTAIVSFWAKAASGTPKIAVEVSQNFGTGGSPSTAVTTYAGQITISSTWTRYSISISVPSISGKTLGTAGDDSLSLLLWTSAGSNYNSRTGSLGIQNTTIDFWGVQVEEGSTLSPFEQEAYATNLQRCQRYYLRIRAGSAYGRVAAGSSVSTSRVNALAPIPTPMRAGPTVSGAATLQVSDGVTGFTISTLVIDGTSSQVPATTAVLLEANVVGTLTQYRPYFIEGQNNATGYVDLNAEL